MSNEVMWDPNPAGGTLGPIPTSKEIKEIRVTTSGTPGTVQSVAQILGVTTLRYLRAVLRASPSNSGSNPVMFAHNSGAGFAPLYPNAIWVDEWRDRTLDFNKLYLKSASASQEVFIEYIEP